jgi:hypothetical protein
MKQFEMAIKKATNEILKRAERLVLQTKDIQYWIYALDQIRGVLDVIVQSELDSKYELMQYVHNESTKYSDLLFPKNKKYFCYDARNEIEIGVYEHEGIKVQERFDHKQDVVLLQNNIFIQSTNDGRWYDNEGNLYCESYLKMGDDFEFTGLFYKM